VGSSQYKVGGRAHAAAAAVRLIPPNVAVSVTNTLGAHLSSRRRVFSFPRLEEARWVAVDTLRMSYLDDNVARTKALRALRRLRHDPRWHVVFARKHILVLHRS
jgi:hypothetical protein